MSSAQGFSEDGNAAPQRAFGLMPSLGSGLERAQTGQHCPDFRVFCAQVAAESAQGVPIEFPGRAEALQLDEDRSQRRLVRRECHGIMPAVPSSKVHSVTRAAQCLPVAPASVLHAPEIVVEGGNEFGVVRGLGPEEFERAPVIARGQVKPPAVLADHAKIIQQCRDFVPAGNGQPFRQP